MKLIPLTRGCFAIVDDADYEAVSAFKWFAKPGGRGMYAARAIVNSRGVKTTQYLHQFLMPGVPEIDHKNGCPLDNRRENLRVATRSENQRGRQQKPLGCSSKFRGVHLHKRTGKWRARISVNKKSICLGLFSSEESAARAYDAGARQYFGEYAAPNFL